jgi:hypothetical protein
VTVENDRRNLRHIEPTRPLQLTPGRESQEEARPDHPLLIERSKPSTLSEELETSRQGKFLLLIPKQPGALIQEENSGRGQIVLTSIKMTYAI